MALSSIVEIANQACDELGLTRPSSTSFTASSVPQDRQMLALIHAAGNDLMFDHDWSQLIATADITLATASASYSLPSDFARVIEGTEWDRTNLFPLNGNIPIQRHQYWLSSLAVVPTTRKEYRLFLGNNASTVYVHPVPQAAESLSFLYVKKYWITDLNGANPADRFAADTDLTLFNPLLMVKELKWRFRNAKGLDATAEKISCDNYKDQLLARDISTSTVDMTSGSMNDTGLSLPMIPDGNWSL